MCPRLCARRFERGTLSQSVSYCDVPHADEAVLAMARLDLSVLATAAEPEAVDSTLISSELGLGSDPEEASNFVMPLHASLGSLRPGPNAFRAAAMGRKDGDILAHCNLGADSGPDGLPHFPSVMVQRCRVLGLVSDGRFCFGGLFRGALGRAKVSMSILKHVAG